MATQKEKFENVAEEAVTYPQQAPPKYPEVLKRKMSKEERAAIEAYDQAWEKFFKEQFSRTF